MSTPRSPDRPPLTSTRGWRWCVALLLTLSCGLARAAEGAGSAEIERLARERAAVEHNAQLEQAACALRFAVNSCVERVRAERRERFLKLDRERADIDDERRKQRAAQRMAKLQDRQPERAAPSVRKAARGPEPAGSAPPAAQVQRRAAGATEREAAALRAEAVAARRAEASARRASQAQAHRENVAKRNADKAASKAPSKPLPLPPAASAAQ